MNLGQLIDPAWVQNGKPRRMWERMEADSALVTKALQAEAERKAKLDAERAREAAAERRLIEQQAEREAAQSRARAAVERPLRVSAPLLVAVAKAAPKQASKAAPRAAGKKALPKKGAYGYNSLRILKLLRSLSMPQRAAALCDLLPDISRNSVQAFMAGFVGRQYATRSGKPGVYKFTLGPRGKTYLDTFSTPD